MFYGFPESTSEGVAFFINILYMGVLMLQIENALTK